MTVYNRTVAAAEFLNSLPPSMNEQFAMSKDPDSRDEGVALNQLINVALAEKVSTLHPEDYSPERASRADGGAAIRVLARGGKGKPLPRDDELPLNVVRERKSRKLAKPIARRVASRKQSYRP